MFCERGMKGLARILKGLGDSLNSIMAEMDPAHLPTEGFGDAIGSSMNIVFYDQIIFHPKIDLHDITLDF